MMGMIRESEMDKQEWQRRTDEDYRWLLRLVNTVEMSQAKRDAFNSAIVSLRGNAFEFGRFSQMDSGK